MSLEKKGYIKDRIIDVVESRYLEVHRTVAKLLPISFYNRIMKDIFFISVQLRGIYKFL
jgi:hypothetical protein